MKKPIGRFAPSPTGRMHFGNIVTALASWLSVKSRGGKWILRIEDLDPQRSKEEWMSLIEKDLRWLGLEWDEGGMADRRYRQSCRYPLYAETLSRLEMTGLTYGCTCRRADILATQAPHQSDGRVIYGGRCRPSTLPYFGPRPEALHAVRLYVPDGKTVSLTDGVFGNLTVDLSRECGDFVVKRADGAWAYQLAVVVDDALMGVTEVMRGSDLLLSAAQQAYLFRMLDYQVPEFVHLPLICNSSGQRLSKRDRSMSMDLLRERFTPEELLGKAAFALGLRDDDSAADLDKLLVDYDRAKIKKSLTVNIDDELNVLSL